MNPYTEYKLYGKNICEIRWNIHKHEREEFWKRFNNNPIKRSILIK